MTYWEIIAYNLSKGGWTWGCVAAARMRTSARSLEFFHKQDAHEKRLTRNSPSETIAPRNRGLVMDRHADDCD